MYKCKPERNVKQAFAAVAISFAICLAVFTAASLIPSVRGILQLVGVLLLVAAIFIVVRYSLTEMEYTITESDFSARKITGNRSQEVCCVALSSAIRLVDRAEYIKNFKKDTNISYNLCQNIRAKSFVLMVEFNGKTAALEFEPNPAFLAIAKKMVAGAIERRESELSD